MSRNVQFITDAEGNRIAVILPIDEYEKLLKDIQLGRTARESKTDNIDVAAETTFKKEITEEELREKLLKTPIGRSALAAHEEYLRNGGVPLDIEGIRRLVAKNRAS